MTIVEVTTQPHVFIAMPVEALVDAGIRPTDVIEIYVEDEKVIIRKAQPGEDFVCDGDCVNCPFGEVECEKDDN